MNDMDDSRVAYAAALAQTATIVAAVRPGQLGDPTPCTDYDVRGLLSHVVAGIHRAATVGEGGDPLAQPMTVDDVADWSAAYAAAVDRATAAWADDSTLDRMVTVPWGTIPGRAALEGYVMEVLTHGWDLATATGQPTELDPALAERALSNARRTLPPEAPRGGPIPFEAPVDPAPDAGPYGRLAAWLGRKA